MEGYLIALIVAGVADAISFMVVSPSLIFYVLQQGGTKEQYGIIMSSFSFASFCAKPFVGHFSDKFGFKIPYAISLGIACFGSLLYVISNNIMSSSSTTSYVIPFTNGMNPSVFGILLSRLLMGVGAANAALGYAYVARVVPNDKQTSVNAFLSMGRIGGMSIGPGFNALLSKVHIQNILNPLNSVGIVVLLCNIVAIVAIFILLDEPPPIDEEDDEDYEEDIQDVTNGKQSNETIVEENGTTTKEEEGSGKTEQTPLLLHSSSNSVSYTLYDKIIACTTTARIFIPICSIFMFNANFQLIETGFAPAASDGLGWGPVQISMVLGGLSIMVAAGFAGVSFLSSKLHVCDEHLLMSGLIVNAISYACVYFGWKRDTTFLLYVLPVAGGALSFPFLAVPTRTIYTMGVKNQPSLKKSMGSMQALLSMFASVAGFTVPAFVASYCNRPSNIITDNNPHEMSKWTLLAPLMAIGVLIGVIYIHVFEKNNDDQNDNNNKNKDQTTTIKEASSSTGDNDEKKDVTSLSPKRSDTALTTESSIMDSSRSSDHKIVELEPGQIRRPSSRFGTTSNNMRRSTTGGGGSRNRRQSSTTCRRPSSYLRSSETTSLICQSLDQSHILNNDDDEEEEGMVVEV